MSIRRLCLLLCAQCTQVGKPCWHAIEVPSAEDRARCFWLIEYNSMACCLELVRYSVYSQQGAGGEKVKVWPPHPPASSKHADAAALSSASGCDWSISLGYYGYLSSACCHLAYDGADGVLLRSCDDHGSIFLFSAKTGVCVRKLFTVDTAAGLGRPLNFAVDHSGVSPPLLLLLHPHPPPAARSRSLLVRHQVNDVL
jgi:hypothetical protein